MAKQPLRLTKVGKAVVGLLVVSLGFGLGAAGSVISGFPLFSYDEKQTAINEKIDAAVSEAFPSREEVGLTEADIHIPNGAVAALPIIKEIHLGTMQETSATLETLPLESASQAETDPQNQSEMNEHAADANVDVTKVSPAAGKTMVEVPEEMLELLNKIMLPESGERKSKGGTQVHRGSKTDIEVFSPKTGHASKDKRLVITSTEAERSVANKIENTTSRALNSRSAGGGPGGLSSDNGSAHGVTVTYGNSQADQKVSQDSGVTVYRGVPD